MFIAGDLIKIIPYFYNIFKPIEQAGFSTNDHLLSLKQLIEKSNEYNIPFVLTFGDYEKAFDAVELLPILLALDDMSSCRDSRYTNLILNIYDKATYVIKINDRLSKKIKIRRGVLEVDTISPKLFNHCRMDLNLFLRIRTGQTRESIYFM